MEVRKRVERALDAIRTNPLPRPLGYWAKAYKVNTQTLYDAIHAAGLQDRIHSEYQAIDAQAGVLLEMHEYADRAGLTFREAMIEACKEWLCRKGVIVATMLLSLSLLTLVAGCGKSEDPAQPADTVLVELVGGWEKSQLEGRFFTELQARCPKARVQSAGTWNGYKSDFGAALAAETNRKRVLIGHSFGGEAVAVYTSTHPMALTILLDPVRHGWQGELPTPQGSVLLLVKPHGLPPTAPVAGVEPRVISGTDHNGLPTDPRVLNLIVEAINAL